ncbi:MULTISPECIES: PIN domain-containing protein [unclassified Stygiolobus]|uniref:PIN domain-containing protein n=1 Tax=unclassified Stygiolobus TaxID=2824672 RepID=UPI00307CF7AF
MDSYAWIELFLGSEKGKKVVEIVSSADEVITPDLVLAEIGRKYIREGANEKEVKNRLKFVEENSIVACLDADISIEGGKTYLELLEKSKKERKNKPALTDSILLALARKYSAKIVSGDKIFEGMKEVILI